MRFSNVGRKKVQPSLTSNTSDPTLSFQLSYNLQTTQIKRMYTLPSTAGVLKAPRTLLVPFDIIVLRHISPKSRTCNCLTQSRSSFPRNIPCRSNRLRVPKKHFRVLVHEQSILSSFSSLPCLLYLTCLPAS
jgi:hypothetical protein